MAMGGMRDHIGGGFHRYSVDAAWRVPHFEKMLYDQAQLTLAYLEAAQATGDDFYATVAEDTLAYVMRDLTDRDGGFYSAEDADSVPPEQAGDPSAHKSEGAFYIWTDAEIGEVTGDDAAIVRRRFGIEPDGNAPQDPQGEFTGRNLLYVAQTVDDIAAPDRPDARGRGRRARPRAGTALRRARASAAAAPRRQGAHGVERPDDRRLRARRARARRERDRAAVSRGRDVAPPSSSSGRSGSSPSSGCCAAIATATPRSTATPRTTRT